eukprot:1150259-Pelagomonas_calceolata.AAC.3
MLVKSLVPPGALSIGLAGSASCCFHFLVGTPALGVWPWPAKGHARPFPALPVGSLVCTCRAVSSSDKHCQAGHVSSSVHLSSSVSCVGLGVHTAPAAHPELRGGPTTSTACCPAPRYGWVGLG